MKILFIDRYFKCKMNKSSYFIPEKALFGSYPNPDLAKELENNGVTLFIDLTEDHEIINKISIIRKFTKISYPITDRKSSLQISYHLYYLSIKLINFMSSLKNDEKIYVHCKGGHGRAGILVACLLCYIYDIDPNIALELTSKYHSTKRNETKMETNWVSTNS